MDVVRRASSAATSRPPGRAGLDRVLRIVDAGPRYFYRSALASCAVTCLLTVFIALGVRPTGPLPQSQRVMIGLAVAGLCAVVVLTLGAVAWPPGRRGRWLDHIAGPEQRAAIWLALTAWFPFLLVVAYFKARATLPPTVAWLAFGYLDKRWVTSAYLLGALAPMLLLVTAARVLAAGREHPRNWRSWFCALAPQHVSSPPPASEPPADAPATNASSADASPTDTLSADEPLADASSSDASPVGPLAPPDRVAGFAWRGLASARVARAARSAAGLFASVSIAWYFWGPPWYLSRGPGSGPIGFQEDIFLSGFQAISKGAIPYIGPATEQYGPGLQFLSYFYMRHIGTFSVVGFRESWALFQWGGATILFLVFFLALGLWRGIAAMLLSALVYPALQSVGFMPGQAYTGFFGWAEPLRYAGAIALILLLPAVIARCPARRGLAAAAALGLLFGTTSYLAQENLAAGVVGAIAVSALLLLTGTSSFRSVATALLSALAGFAVVWVPVLAYYAVHGVLARFLQLYLLVPQAVAEGYSNTRFGGHQVGAAAQAGQERWAPFFYVLPFILALLALLAIVRLRPLRVAWEWSRERVALVAIVITTILLYQGALLRSDASHLSGTLLATPGLAIMVATVLPRLLGAWRPLTLAVGGFAIFAASFLLLPQAIVSPANVRARAQAPYLDRQRLAGEPARAAPTTIAGARVGAGLAVAGPCCQDASVPMSSFIAFMDHLHAIIGNRATYVVGFPAGYPGIVYFVADLTPAPVPIDQHTMVMNVPQYRAYLATFRSSVLPRTAALVTQSLSAPEARYFRDFYPSAGVITLSYRDTPLYVLLRSS